MMGQHLSHAQRGSRCTSCRYFAGESHCLQHVPVTCCIRHQTKRSTLTSLPPTYFDCYLNAIWTGIASFRLTCGESSAEEMSEVPGVAGSM